jgi:hypothetical protein
MVRGARKAAHFFSVISGINILCLLITASTFRYRTIGRVCSGESVDGYSFNSGTSFYEY